MFKRIDHVEIVTKDMDRTIDFYTGVLGFKLKSRQKVGPPGGKAMLEISYIQLGDTVVELLAFDGAPVADAPQNEHLGYRMMALEVTDMDQTAAYLKSKGIDIVWGPMKADNGIRAEICDNNGYHIELRQWLS
jgi:catechol 2,3-dioxygenase-like lactoylglutathione lyase family enzyme